MERKPIKYLDKVKGPLVRPCPAAKSHLCCNYVVISQVLNCPFSCSYCYLRTFYGKDEIVIVRDEEKIAAEVEQYLENASEPLRVGTGEFSDSLALPEAISLGRKLVKLFGCQDKHLLELKTKSDQVDELLGLEHKGRTVISWSVNPEKIVREEELGASSLAERLAAAKKCARTGYPIAFHFDPIIYYQDWARDYEAVIDRIFSAVDGSGIAWISLGALRFPPAQKEAMVRSGTRISFDHFIKGPDKKLRYPEELRAELFGRLYPLLRKSAKEAYIYLCMESEAVWQAAGVANDITGKFAHFFRFSVKE